MSQTEIAEKNSLQITEEMGIHKKWYEEAKEIKVEELEAFVKRLSTGYQHDYGTICHAVAASAVAAASAVNSSEQGGITGFQAGVIMWEFIKHWMHYEQQPMRLVQYKDLLYPQHEYRFTGITKDTWEWLQEEAKKNLEEDHGADVVRAHWQSIVDGKVPFGLDVYED